MHRYMRAIGFSSVESRRMLKEILAEVVVNSDQLDTAVSRENLRLGDYCKNFTRHLGVAVCGEYDERNHFVYDYYFPYLLSDDISSNEELSIERHAEKNSFAGVCDEMRVGITLIFYLQNRIPFVKAHAQGRLPVRGTTLTLTGLSTSGTILLPIRKDMEQINRVNERKQIRAKLMEEARKGSEEAMETLTLEEMDMYSVISNRIHTEDILTMVDTCFMPYGVECDQYSILGEIRKVDKETNPITGEEIYILKVESNDLTFDVCINIIDLFGEPQVGRRFKGTIWLQGQIHYPEEDGASL